MARLAAGGGFTSESNGLGNRDRNDGSVPFLSGLSNPPQNLVGREPCTFRRPAGAGGEGVGGCKGPATGSGCLT